MEEHVVAGLWDGGHGHDGLAAGSAGGAAKRSSAAGASAVPRLLQIGLLHDVLLIDGWVNHEHPATAENGCAAAVPAPWMAHYRTEGWSHRAAAAPKFPS